jgi:hypothetical protein
MSRTAGGEQGMALRANHYDAAFEAYVRAQGWAYVAVNEARRACLAGVSLKSLDFIVTAPGSGPLLVDVKGRRWPAAGDHHRRRWENWATQDDLDSLARWELAFGAAYRGLLVFAYDLPASAAGPADSPRFAFREREYVFYGVWAQDYRQAMRVRSPQWDTVWLPSQPFQNLRFSLAEGFGGATDAGRSALAG